MPIARSIQIEDGGKDASKRRAAASGTKQVTTSFSAEIEKTPQGVKNSIELGIAVHCNFFHGCGAKGGGTGDKDGLSGMI